LLDNKAEVNEISFFSFTKDAESLYDLIGFSDRKKAMEFLYAVELLRVKPDEFKDKYESTYGKLTEDYGEFLKKTYNPYFVEVTSKLFYYNLAQKLTKEEMTLSDVFYLISMYESDLLKDIPFNISDVKQKYIDTYEKYINMQKEFFNLLQNVADKDVLQAFGAYNMNYGEGTVYANASLKWLDARKKDYLIYRNNILYSKNRMCMLDFCEDD